MPLLALLFRAPIYTNLNTSLSSVQFFSITTLRIKPKNDEVKSDKITRWHPSITSVSVQPGVIQTELVTNLPVIYWATVWTGNLGKYLMKEGVFNTLWAATGLKAEIEYDARYSRCWYMRRLSRWNDCVWLCIHLPTWLWFLWFPNQFRPDQRQLELLLCQHDGRCFPSVGRSIRA